MDTSKLTDVLRATIDPNLRQQAEEQLSQMEKIVGFSPALLEVIMLSDVDMPVRQAGVMYLKNLMTEHWGDGIVLPGQSLPFSINEQDCAKIRDAIVDAVVHAPDLIRVELAVCIRHIISCDLFHGRTQIVDKIIIYFQNPDAAGWTGALMCLYQLVKYYGEIRTEERGPLNEAMNLIFPMMYQLCVRLLPDQSEQSVLLQKQILKIYFALTQYYLQLDLISREVFSQWMEIACSVAGRPVPEQTNVVDEKDRADLPWWKCRKWALRIVHRMFERYGSPGNVAEEYKDFAKWYLETFSIGILEALLKILDQYRRKIYVSPCVIQQTINYINLGVSYAFSWKLLKPHMFAIVQDVLFPILSYSQADEELWNTDPYEYIRVKFDVFEGFVSPVTAAQQLLHSCCKKRKDMLQETMHFIMQVLTSPNADPRQKDGALHMVGALADVLLSMKLYKAQMDEMLCQYVFPEFSSFRGHMRARACWVLHYFSKIKFKQEAVLAEAIRLTTNALLRDQDLPVKVEAAIALQMLLSEQDKAQKYIEPQIIQLTLELLPIIRETEINDLTNVMLKIVCTYTEQLKPIAVEMCQHLVATFTQCLETDDDSDEDSDEDCDERIVTALGFLNTIKTLLRVMVDHSEMMAQLQPTVLQLVGYIFSHSLLEIDHDVELVEFYEETLSLVYDLTSKTILPDMWKVLELMYQSFQRNGLHYFVDMMPALHNYVTVDTPAFLSNLNHVMAVFNMCKAVLTGDAGEDPECHAAKLLEVIILQCKGHIDQCIPSFVELVLQRLTREVKTSELRTMCLQVVIAALYYNPQLLWNTLDILQLAVSPTEFITSHFIKQWLDHTDCFLGLHDRKLCVLGLCTLLTSGARPDAVNEYASQIVPSLILLFDGLKRAYVAKAQEDEEEKEDEGDEEEENEEESDIDEEFLSSDEDEVPVAETRAEYLEELLEKVKKVTSAYKISVSAYIQNDDETDDELDDEADDELDDDYEPNEGTLETYTTPLDGENCEVNEYIVFKEVLQNIQTSDSAWYQALTADLTPEQQNMLAEVMVLADQRKARSGGVGRLEEGSCRVKRKEQSGGYVFNQQTVPTSFKFGGTPLD